MRTAIILDVSGSFYKESSLLLPVIKSLLSLNVIDCAFMADNTVTKINDNTELHVIGGGGSIHPIEAIRSIGEFAHDVPIKVVYFTDGYYPETAATLPSNVELIISILPSL